MKLTVLLLLFRSFVIVVSQSPTRYFNTKTLELTEPLKINTKITVTAEFVDLEWCSVYVGNEVTTPSYLSLLARTNEIITSNFLNNTYFNYQKKHFKNIYEEGSPFHLEIVIKEKATIFTLQGTHVFEQPHYDLAKPFIADRIEVHNFRNAVISIDRSNEVEEPNPSPESITQTDGPTEAPKRHFNVATMHLLEPLKINTKVTIRAQFVDLVWCSVYVGTDEKTPSYLSVLARDKEVITSNYIDKTYINYQKRPLKYPYKVGSQFLLDIIIQENSTIFKLQGEHVYEQPHDFKVKPFEAERIEVHNFKDVSFSIDRSNENKVTTQPMTDSASQCRRSDLVSLIPSDEKWKFEYYTVKNELENTNINPELNYDVIEIQKIYNSCLWKKFSERKYEISLLIQDTNVKLLFHGSPDAKHFATYGFNKAPGAGRVYKEGFLLASHSSQSNDYTEIQSDGNRYMLLCRVALGRTKIETSSKRSPYAPVGYHSVQQTLKGTDDEYIVYRTEQIYPAYLITYRIR